MPTEITVPDLGESIVEATIAEWLKAVGDPVKAGEPVLMLETDKVDLEVGATKDGVLAEIRSSDPNMVTVTKFERARLPAYTGSTTFRYLKIPESKP